MSIHPTGNAYAFMPDLLQLHGRTNPSPPHLPPPLTRIVTPLRHAAWSKWLHHHPDRLFVCYLTTGITEGFRIGFNHIGHSCISAKTNHPSANEHPAVISRSLEMEVAKGRMLGPLDPTDF